MKNLLMLLIALIYVSLPAQTDGTFDLSNSENQTNDRELNLEYIDEVDNKLIMNLYNSNRCFLENG